MWARSDRQGEGGFSPLRSHAGTGAAAHGTCFASSSVSASLMMQERDGPAAGQWYSEGTHHFNLSLTGRPASARGRFEAMDGGYCGVGDLFFIPAGQRYLARGGPGRQRTLFIEMKADQRIDALAAGGVTVLRTCMNLPFDRFRDLLLRMAREASAPGFASGLMIEGLGLTLLAETMRMLRQVEANAARKGGLSPWRLRAIEARLRDGAAAPSLGELADLCGLSRRQLMRAFREETGQTIGAYAQGLTLDRARALLCDTDLPIKEIAARVGFSNGTSFATAFRRMIGESPSSFRAARGRN